MTTKNTDASNEEVKDVQNEQEEVVKTETTEDFRDNVIDVVDLEDDPIMAEQVIDKYYDVSKDVIESLTFNDLSRSKSISGLGIVSNIEIVRHMNEMLNKSPLDFVLDKMYAKNNRINGQDGIEIDHDSLEQFPTSVNDKEQTVYDPRSLKFNRVIGSFKIASKETEEMYGFIGFAATHKGYELAIGTEVSVCANMCILGPDHRIATFGSNKVKDVNAMMQQLQDWIDNYEEIQAENFAKIEELKNTLITERDVRVIFGDLYERTHRKPEHFILGAVQLSKSQDEYVHTHLESENNQIENMWQLYNAFTMGLKFDKVDFLNVFTQNQKIYEYLKNQGNA